VQGQGGGDEPRRLSEAKTHDFEVQVWTRR